MTATQFEDRTQAGRALGAAVAERLGGTAAVVLGLPRGGVPVAAPVATALGAPLDVFVVRKLGAPGQPELAVGALASGGVRVLNDAVLASLRVSEQELAQTTDLELAELERRERSYRGDRPAAALAGRTVVLVDDGLATGATVRAAVAGVRGHRPRSVVVAVPVGSPEGVATVAAVADDLVCLHAPAGFGSVGTHYADFSQTTDEEVRRLLGA